MSLFMVQSPYDKMGGILMKKIFLKLLSIFSLMFVFMFNVNVEAECKSRPKISIIVPVYNVEKYLPECMDSLINQTLKEIEIICIDDGSIDKSGKILDDYSKKDERIKVIHQKNQGVSAARNVGIDISNGEYMTFVDADDYVDPECYETAYKWAIKDDIDVLQFRHNKVNDKSKDKPKNESKDKLSDSDVLNLEQFLKKSFSGFVWFKIIKSDIIKNNNIRFMTDISLSEDACFSYMVFPRATKFKIIPGKFYNYRSRPGSAVKKWNRNDYNNRQMISIINHVYDNWKEGNLIKGREHILLEFVIHIVRGKETKRVDDILKIVNKLNSPKVLSKCSEKCRKEIEKLKKKSSKNRKVDSEKIGKKAA